MSLIQNSTHTHTTAHAFDLLVPRINFEGFTTDGLTSGQCH